MVYSLAMAIRVIKGKGGGGEPWTTQDATRGSHAKQQSGILEGRGPTSARRRNQAQVAAAAEAKPPIDAAPLGSAAHAQADPRWSLHLCHRCCRLPGI